MTFSYELGRPSLHFVKNHPANLQAALANLRCQSSFGRAIMKTSVRHATKPQRRSRPRVTPLKKARLADLYATGKRALEHTPELKDQRNATVLYVFGL
jgi:hypothetical protein